MKVKCLVCGKEMIADETHPGFQSCDCKNQTMVDWCDEHICLGGVDPRRMEVDGVNCAYGSGRKTKKTHPKLKWLGKKTLHLIISFILGVALATVFHTIVANHRVRKTAEAICNVFSRDVKECKDNIDNVFDMADTEVENNIEINGGGK